MSRSQIKTANRQSHRSLSKQFDEVIEKKNFSKTAQGYRMSLSRSNKQPSRKKYAKTSSGFRSRNKEELQMNQSISLLRAFTHQQNTRSPSFGQCSVFQKKKESKIKKFEQHKFELIVNKFQVKRGYSLSESRGNFQKQWVPYRNKLTFVPNQENNAMAYWKVVNKDDKWHKHQATKNIRNKWVNELQGLLTHYKLGPPSRKRFNYQRNTYTSYTNQRHSHGGTQTLPLVGNTQTRKLLKTRGSSRKIKVKLNKKIHPNDRQVDDNRYMQKRSNNYGKRKKQLTAFNFDPVFYNPNLYRPKFDITKNLLLKKHNKSQKSRRKQHKVFKKLK